MNYPLTRTPDTNQAELFIHTKSNSVGENTTSLNTKLTLKILTDESRSLHLETQLQTDELKQWVLDILFERGRERKLSYKGVRGRGKVRGGTKHTQIRCAVTSS